jgi:hypothetical protein
MVHVAVCGGTAISEILVGLAAVCFAGSKVIASFRISLLETG